LNYYYDYYCYYYYYYYYSYYHYYYYYYYYNCATSSGRGLLLSKTSTGDLNPGGGFAYDGGLNKPSS